MNTRLSNTTCEQKPPPVTLSWSSLLCEVFLHHLCCSSSSPGAASSTTAAWCRSARWAAGGTGSSTLRSPARATNHDVSTAAPLRTPTMMFVTPRGELQKPWRTSWAFWLFSLLWPDFSPSSGGWVWCNDVCWPLTPSLSLLRSGRHRLWQAAVCVWQNHSRVHVGGPLQPQPAVAAVPRPRPSLPPGQQTAQTTGFPRVQRGERGAAGRRFWPGDHSRTQHTSTCSSEQVRGGAEGGSDQNSCWVRTLTSYKTDWFITDVSVRPIQGGCF